MSFTIMLYVVGVEACILGLGVAGWWSRRPAKAPKERTI